MLWTPNSPPGQVSWWYHVAPIVEVGGQKIVLDPAIEPHHPLKLEDWLAQMAPNISQLKVAICASGTYGPYDLCDQATDGIEQPAQDDQVYYLNSEWGRLVDLNRNPNNELGDSPPWLSKL